MARIVAFWIQSVINISYVEIERRSWKGRTQEGVRTCTDTAISARDPVIGGDNRCLGIFHRGPVLVKCGGKSRVLLWFVDNGTTLQSIA